MKVCLLVYVRLRPARPTEAITLGFSFHPGSKPGYGVTKNVDPIWNFLKGKEFREVQQAKVVPLGGFEL